MIHFQEGEALDEARKLARALGHAVALLAVGPYGYERYETADSWLPVSEDFRVVALVSVSGKVVRTPEGAR